MKRHTVIYKSFDIVIVPFPFVDSLQTKIRPALVLSDAEFNRDGSVILVMISSALHQQRAHDHVIADLVSTNLPSASLIRMKLFTLDNRLIHKKIGQLGEIDQVAFKKIFRQVCNKLL